MKLHANAALSLKRTELVSSAERNEQCNAVPNSAVESGTYFGRCGRGRKFEFWD